MNSKKSSLVYLPDLHVFARLLASRILLSAQLLISTSSLRCWLLEFSFLPNSCPSSVKTILLACCHLSHDISSGSFSQSASHSMGLVCPRTGVLAGFKTSLPALITGSGRLLKPCLIQVTSSLSVSRKRQGMFVFACATPKHLACLGVGFLSRWLEGSHLLA